ncbi:MAG: deoxyribonuclease IV [Candidatus Dependentiae bacterium]|nr:deoxyribonuclease IV [Candidatus Dependentiae bacterium]
MTKKVELLLGAHVSAAGGLKNAIAHGTDLGCSAIQLFTKNNRQWSFDDISDEEADAFIAAQKESAIRIVVSHASYLINLASPKREVRSKSMRALHAELRRCQRAKIPFLVLHPGSCLSVPNSECSARIAAGLSEIFDKTEKEVVILLENMAGQGSATGCQLEQLAEIREKTSPKSRVGFCFDTCHGFAEGYDLSTPEKYHAFWRDFDKILGLKHLHAMHLNDSKRELGSHVDRHEHIGKGLIGLETFRLVMRDKQLFDVPKIIETPVKTPGAHARDLALLRKLAGKD